MSGGSYDYFYLKLQDFASDVRARANDGHTKSKALRLAFANHLDLVAKAAHALEWVDSCDWGYPDEVEPMRACLPERAEILASIEEGKRAIEQIEMAIESAQVRP